MKGEGGWEQRGAVTCAVPGAAPAPALGNPGSTPNPHDHKLRNKTQNTEKNTNGTKYKNQKADTYQPYQFSLIIAEFALNSWMDFISLSSLELVTTHQ